MSSFRLVDFAQWGIPVNAIFVAVLCSIFLAATAPNLSKCDPLATPTLTDCTGARVMLAFNIISLVLAVISGGLAFLRERYFRTVYVSLALLLASVLFGSVFCAFVFKGRAAFDLLVFVIPALFALEWPAYTLHSMGTSALIVIGLRASINFGSPYVVVSIDAGFWLAIDLVLYAMLLTNFFLILVSTDEITSHLQSVGQVVNQIATACVQEELPNDKLRETLKDALSRVSRRASTAMISQRTGTARLTQRTSPQGSARPEITVVVEHADIDEEKWSEREVTLLCVFIPYFDNFIKDKGLENGERLLRNLWRDLVRLAELHGGTIERSCGSLMYVSFNATEIESLSHQFTACRCAIKLQEIVTKSAKDLQALMGLVSQKVIRGQIPRCPGYILSGPIFEQALMVTRLNMQLGTSVLFTDGVYAAVNTRILFRHVDTLKGVSGTIGPVNVYEALGTGPTPPWVKGFNAAFTSFCEGRLAEASLAIQDHLISMGKTGRGDQRAERILAVCRECAAKPFDAPYYRRVFEPPWSMFRGEPFVSESTFQYHPDSVPEDWAGTVSTKRHSHRGSLSSRRGSGMMVDGARRVSLMGLVTDPASPLMSPGGALAAVTVLPNATPRSPSGLLANQVVPFAFDRRKSSGSARGADYQVTNTINNESRRVSNDSISSLGSAPGTASGLVLGGAAAAGGGGGGGTGAQTSVSSLTDLNRVVSHAESKTSARSGASSIASPGRSGSPGTSQLKKSPREDSVLRGVSTAGRPHSAQKYQVVNPPQPVMEFHHPNQPMRRESLESGGSGSGGGVLNTSVNTSGSSSLIGGASLNAVPTDVRAASPPIRVGSGSPTRAQQRASSPEGISPKSRQRSMLVVHTKSTPQTQIPEPSIEEATPTHSASMPPSGNGFVFPNIPLDESTNTQFLGVPGQHSPQHADSGSESSDPNDLQSLELGSQSQPASKTSPPVSKEGSTILSVKLPMSPSGLLRPRPAGEGSFSGSIDELVLGTSIKASLTPRKKGNSVAPRPLKQIFRICLTGGPCSGKSTSISVITSKMSMQGVAVFSVPEAATLLINGGLAFDDMTPQKAIAFQTVLMKTQIALEDGFFAIAQAIGAARSLVVCDRGTFDGKAYSSDDEWKQICENVGQDTIQLRDQRYDAVFHLATAADGAEEFYTLENNTARTETPEQARAIDAKLKTCWIGHPHLELIDNSTAFEEKIERVVRSVIQLMGLSQAPTGEVHCFLVEKSPATFPIKTEVTQISTMLLRGSSVGNELRICKRGINGKWMFFSQKVAALPGGTKLVRSERRITNRQYSEMLFHTDSALHGVVQTVHSFVWKNRSFELQQFHSPKTWEDKAFLCVRIDAGEILEDEDFPDFIDKGQDVTDKPGWSFYEIASHSSALDGNVAANDANDEYN